MTTVTKSIRTALERNGLLKPIRGDGRRGRDSNPCYRPETSSRVRNPDALIERPVGAPPVRACARPKRATAIRALDASRAAVPGRSMSACSSRRLEPCPVDSGGGEAHTVRAQAGSGATIGTPKPGMWDCELVAATGGHHHRGSCSGHRRGEVLAARQARPADVSRTERTPAGSAARGDA